MSQGRKVSRRKFLQGVGAFAAGTTLGPLTMARQGIAAGALVEGAGLGPPSNASYLVPIIRELKLDAKHGLDYRPKLYSRLGAMYSDFAAHKTESLYFGGLSNAARFHSKGLPVQITLTYSTANHAFISKNPKIREAEDLKGKRVAATTASGFWGMAVMFLRQHGLNARTDLSVISASPPAVATQLQAGRVDAGIVWEPNLSKMLTSGYHLVGDMSDGIRKDLGLPADSPVWYLGSSSWKGWLEKDHKRNAKILQMWRDAAEFFYKQAERADKIVSQFTKIPLKALKYSRDHNFVTFRIEPAIKEKDKIMAVLKGFQSVGRLKKLPDDSAFYSWPALG